MIDIKSESEINNRLFSSMTHVPNTFEAAQNMMLKMFPAMRNVGNHKLYIAPNIHQLVPWFQTLKTTTKLFL